MSDKDEMIERGVMRYEIGFNKPLLLACFVTICCCPLFGGFALVYAVQAQVAVHANNYSLSNSNLKKAKKMSCIGIVLGMLINIIFITIFVSYAYAIQSITNSYAQKMPQQLETSIVQNNRLIGG